MLLFTGSNEPGPRKCIDCKKSYKSCDCKVISVSNSLLLKHWTKQVIIYLGPWLISIQSLFSLPIFSQVNRWSEKRKLSTLATLNFPNQFLQGLRLVWLSIYSFHFVHTLKVCFERELKCQITFCTELLKVWNTLSQVLGN